MRFGLPDEVVQKLRDIFSSFPQVRRVRIYGSRAKGDFRPGSDIDLCIEADTLHLSDLFAIETRIDNLLLPWKVDLSLQHKIDNQALLDHIDRVGVEICRND